LIGAAGTVGGQLSGGAQGKVGTFVTQPPDEPRPWGLLRTKLTVPRPRPDALLRSDLVEYVSAVATPGRVTLVVAGAGWGKSTLLASWVGRQPNPDRYAWFSVDEDDNDIGRYWAYVITALTLDDPAALPMSNRLLAAPRASVINEVVPALLNELCALPEPVTLVVDDYHLLTNDEVHHSMRLLVEQLPPTLQLIIASRTTPALPLMRLRGRGRLAEVTVEQLRLSRSETTELLQRETDTTWTAAEVDLLHSRTEGWLTGLHLAALSRRAHAADPAWVAPGFGGDDRFVGEYLHTEVLARLPHELRLLLRRSTIADRFCPDLCHALTGRSDSAELLAQVERDHLFLVPLDTRGEWYRYHHLFADVLRRELERVEPGIAPELHRRAADWFAAQDLPLEAVRHALASGDTACSSELVARYGPHVSGQGYADTALGWFQALGEDVCGADPQLCLAGLTVAMIASRPAEMTRWIDLAQALVDRPDLEPHLADEVRFRVNLARWATASFSGDSAAALRHAENVDRLAAGGPPSRSRGAQAALGLSRYRAGELQFADVALARAGALAQEQGSELTVMLTRGAQAVIAAAGGLTHEAERLAAEAEGVHLPALSEHYDRYYVPFARGWLSLHRGESGQARDLFRRALQLVRRSPLRVDTAEVLTALAVSEQRLGDTEASQAHLAEARHLLEQCHDPGRLLADPRDDQLLTARQPPSPAVAVLTDRETDVITLVAQGCTNQQTGTQLGLSRRTVEAHLATIYRKIGVNNRGAAARYAVEHGLAPRAAQQA
jgi:LuxR family maltose regulon positive regulatory protein